MSPHEPFVDLQHDRAYQEMMKLFEELTFPERMRRMLDGLSKPKDTGDYKFAKFQLQRLSAPLFATVLPILLVVLLVAFGGQGELAQRVTPTEIITPETIDELQEPPPPPEPPEFADPVEMDVTVDISNPQQVSTVQNQPMSPQPAQFDSVAIIKSPIVMRGIYGSRSPGARGQAISRHGGSAAGEAAVMRALRWFAKNQQADGSWNSNKTAMTGLALLCYLAHGETPASEEFGPTVEKAIRFLANSQEPGGLFKAKDSHNYSHPIAAYALCEAYTLTKVPMVKEAAERAMTHIVRGQHPNGGWDYNMKQTERDDTSYMGWCAQAVKAAKMADDLEIPGLEEAYKLSVAGFKVNADPNGGFGYTGKGRGGLTSVGTLCMQLMGSSATAEVQKSLALMDEWVVSWTEPKVTGSCPQYYFYYATQSMFHAGGSRWTKWNSVMLPEYVRAQKIVAKEQSGYVDNFGNPQDIGSWENSDNHTDRPVMDTALATLQLEVYYRYLPTFRTPEVVDQTTVLNSDDDVKVDIQL